MGKSTDNQELKPASAKILQYLQTLQEAADIKKEADFRLSVLGVATATRLHRATVTNHINILSELGLIEYDGKKCKVIKKEKENCNTNKSEIVQSEQLYTEDCTINDVQTNNCTEKLYNHNVQSVQHEDRNVQSKQEIVQNDKKIVQSKKTKEIRKKEQSIPLTQELLESLNRSLIVAREFSSKRYFDDYYKRTLESFIGPKNTEKLKAFVWLDKDVFTVDSDPQMCSWFFDLFSVIICDVYGDKEETSNGGKKNLDIQRLRRYDFDLKDSQKKLLMGKPEQESETDDKTYKRRTFDDDDDDKNDDEDDDVDCSVDDFMEDNVDETDETDEAEPEEKPTHKIIRHDNKRFVEFSPDEVEDIIGDYTGLEISKSPLRTFIYYVWSYLDDYYFETFKDSNRDKKPKEIEKMLDNFKLEDVLVEPGIFEQALKDSYSDIEDLWRNGGYAVYGKDDNGEPCEVEVDWSEVDLFDFFETKYIFKWERVNDTDGGWNYRPSTRGVYNLEAEPIAKPTRVPRSLSDPAYQAYTKENMKYVTELLAAYDGGEESERMLNDLERIIGRFIKKYFNPRPAHQYPELLITEPIQKGMKDGVQLLDPSGNYLHGDGLNKFYRMLGDIGVSPEDFQMCLQNPATDNSYHSYLKVVKNMFWARGIAYICAQKGLSSHFAPSDV